MEISALYTTWNTQNLPEKYLKGGQCVIFDAILDQDSNGAAFVAGLDETQLAVLQQVTVVYCDRRRLNRQGRLRCENIPLECKEPTEVLKLQ